VLGLGLTIRQPNEIGADAEMAVSIPNIVFGLGVRVRVRVYHLS
jgi:hypothetical protein